MGRVKNEGIRPPNSSLSQSSMWKPSPYMRSHDSDFSPACPEFGALPLLARLDWTHAFSSSLMNEAGMTLVRAVGSNPGTSSNKNLPNVNISGVDGFNQWGSAGWVHENRSEE